MTVVSQACRNLGRGKGGGDEAKGLIFLQIERNNEMVRNSKKLNCLKILSIFVILLAWLLPVILNINFCFYCRFCALLFCLLLGKWLVRRTIFYIPQSPPLGLWGCEHIYYNFHLMPFLSVSRQISRNEVKNRDEIYHA